MKQFENPKKFVNHNSEIKCYGIKELKGYLGNYLGVASNVTEREFNQYMSEHWEEGVKEAEKKFRTRSAANKSKRAVATYIQILSRKDCPFDVKGVMDKYEEYCNEERRKLWEEEEKAGLHKKPNIECVKVKTLKMVVDPETKQLKWVEE